MRKSLALSFLSVLLIVLLLTPTVAAEGINILETDDGYSKTEDASESVTFAWSWSAAWCPRAARASGRG